MGVDGRSLRALLLLPALAFAGCGGGGGTSPDTTLAGPLGVVAGTVLAGPVCPVVADPPDPACDDRPVPGAVIEVTRADGTAVAVVAADSAGHFRLTLPPGAFRLTPQPVEGLLGTAPPQEVVVAAGETVELVVSYDTGIR